MMYGIAHVGAYDRVIRPGLEVCPRSLLSFSSCLFGDSIILGLILYV